jgi:hypothetical protein
VDVNRKQSYISYGRVLWLWVLGVWVPEDYKRSVHCNQEEIKLFVGIARRLWLRRNNLVHEGSLSHPISLVQRTVTAMEEFSKAHKGGEATSVLTAMKTPTIWTAPSSG